MNLFFFSSASFLFAKAVVLKIAVGGERIDSRQFQKLIDSILTEKTLERAQPHLRRLDMTQVIAHQIGHPLPRRSAPLQPLQHLFSHFGALFRMAVKGETLLIPPDANRLGHVMQQATVR